MPTKRRKAKAAEKSRQEVARALLRVDLSRVLEPSKVEEIRRVADGEGL